MKNYIYCGAIIAAFFMFAGCSENTTLDGASGGKGVPNNKGKTVPGIYAAFTASPGKFSEGEGTINVPLAFKEIPVVAKWFDVNGDEITGQTDEAKEKAFLEALNNASQSGDSNWDYGYDYEEDPLKLNRTSSSVANPKSGYPAFELSGEIKYRYFINQQKVNDEWVDLFAAPVLGSKIFTHWKVTGTSQPVAVDAGDKDPFDTSVWSIDLPEEIEEQTRPYIHLLAIWVNDPEVGPAKIALQEELDKINHITTTAESVPYKDDYVVSAPIDKSSKLSTLQDLLNQAAELLKGEEHKITLGNIEDSGTQTTGKEVKIIVYQTVKMNETRTAIEKERKKPEVIEELKKGVYPQSLTLLYPTDKYDYNSVTIASDGDYEIELWGATGGAVYSTNNKTALGGDGGHVKAQVKLKAGDVLKFFVGGAGEGSATYNPDPTFTDNDKRFTKISANYDKGKPGGKPNGGRGGDAWNWRDKRPAPTYAGGSGGGGSTDVRLLKAGYTGGKQGHGLGDYNTVYSSTKDNRILVAGGGGGAAQGHDIRGYGWPGIAGGLPGKNGKITGGKEYTGKTAGGEDGIGVTGKAFGGNWEGRGGGGGGYKGGRASTEGEEVASGGGGENYTADTNDANFKGDSDRTIKNLLPNGKPDDPEYISPFYGNGKATIKWVDTTPPAPLPAQGGTP